MSHQGHSPDHLGHDQPTLAQAVANYESTEIRLRPLLIFVAGLFGSVVLVLLVVQAQFAFYVNDQSKGQVTPIRHDLPALTDGPPVEPRLQETPELDMDAFRAEEATKLSKLGWVDRPKGIAEIPIDDAMKLLVQKGLPVRKTPPPPEGEKAPGTRTGRPTGVAPKGTP
ncbi:hypothetical protein EP7_004721 [Isosphaeraceae bacterium EP7]